MANCLLLGLVCIVIGAVYFGKQDNLRAAALWLGVSSILGYVVSLASYHLLSEREWANPAYQGVPASMLDTFAMFELVTTQACLLGAAAFVLCLVLVPRTFTRFVAEPD